MAIKFVDRVPTYPNRIKFTAENGAVTYGVWERADSPTVVGTPINAANLNAMQQNTGLSSNHVMYVSTAGSDNTGDGTQNTPYATISKALSTLPKNLNGYDVTIHVAGGVYNENVTIQKFSSGTIILTGILNENVQINTFAVMSCDVLVTNISLSVSYFNCPHLAHCYISTYLTVRSGAARGINVAEASAVVINSATVDGTTERAVNVSSNGRIFFNYLLGSNNAGVGLVASGGTIMYHESSLVATIASNTGAGGRILSGAQTSIPNY